MSVFAGNSIPRATPAAIAAICVAQFVVVLDATIVTTALPTIRQALGFSNAELQWVFTAYVLVFGGLLIFGGRVSDLAGRRRTFLIGLRLFSAASAGCALAWSPAALVAARVAQGVGAAFLSPAALALLTTLTEPGEARRRGRLVDRCRGWRRRQRMGTRRTDHRVRRMALGVRDQCANRACRTGRRAAGTARRSAASRASAFGSWRCLGCHHWIGPAGVRTDQRWRARPGQPGELAATGASDCSFRDLRTP